MEETTGYLTKKEIIEFQKLCQKYLGKDLSMEQAEDQGTRAVMLMEKLVGFEPVLETYKDMVDFQLKKRQYGKNN